jgi:hypothetical protein
VLYSGLSLAYQLGVKFGQPGLAIVVEDQHSVDRRWCLCARIVVVMTSWKKESVLARRERVRFV